MYSRFCCVFAIANVKSVNRCENSMSSVSRFVISTSDCLATADTSRPTCVFMWQRDVDIKKENNEEKNRSVSYMLHLSTDNPNCNCDGCDNVARLRYLFRLACSFWAATLDEISIYAFLNHCVSTQIVDTDPERKKDKKKRAREKN